MIHIKGWSNFKQSDKHSMSCGHFVAIVSRIQGIGYFIHSTLFWQCTSILTYIEFHTHKIMSQVFRQFLSGNYRQWLICDLSLLLNKLNFNTWMVLIPWLENGLQLTIFTYQYQYHFGWNSIINTYQYLKYDAIMILRRKLCYTSCLPKLWMRHCDLSCYF